MATQRATVDAILDQAAAAGALSARPMFGEYGLYLDGKLVGLICDDTLFLKDLPGARDLIAAPETAPPYPRARPHLVANALLDEPEQLARVLRAIWKETPAPNPKKPRGGKG